MNRPVPGLLAVLGASALIAAGCGSSKSSSASNASNATTAPAAAAGKTTSSATATTPGAPASGGGTVVTVKHAGKLGTILAAGQKKMTVYLFEADRSGASNCSEACVAAWPPVTTSAAPSASGAASSADLGTIKRSDGTMQVTYKGHPLYYFVKDKDSGDSYGEGVKAFGASWYVLAPSGSKVDNS